MDPHDDLQEQLNARGQDSWKLVVAASNDEVDHLRSATFVLKRPLA
jgi:hypothetical protein